MPKPGSLLPRQARQLVDAMAADSVDHSESGLLHQIVGQLGVNLVHRNFGKRGLMAAYRSAYEMWDSLRRHSEDRQVSIKE
jgi:hypothetical protein